MRKSKGMMFAVVAAGLVACGAPSGTAPIATISVNGNAAVQSAPAAEAAMPAGTVTFIEFYAEW